MAMALWRIEVNGKSRLARGRVEDGPQVLMPEETTLAHLLGGTGQAFAAALRRSDGERVPAQPRLR